MKSDSLKQILAFLTRTLEKNDFNEDKQIINKSGGNKLFKLK